MAGLGSAGAYEFGSELGAGAGAAANAAGGAGDARQKNAAAMKNAASRGAGGMGTSK
jgi:hypothetical protein